MRTNLIKLLDDPLFVFARESHGGFFGLLGCVVPFPIQFARRQPADVVVNSYAQSTDMNAEFLLRTKGNPLAFVPSVRTKIANVDPEQPVYEAKTLAQLTREEFVEL